MKFITFLPILALTLLISAFAFADEIPASLTEAEATAIVAAQQASKEAAKDAKEAELMSADIVETAVADLGHQKVIFNRLPVQPEAVIVSPESGIEPQETAVSSFPGSIGKPREQFVFSGTVWDESISEIWWKNENQESFRVFCNANFNYFSGISEIESAETRYSIFMIVTDSISTQASASDEWRPTLADFSPDVIEYFVMEWGNSEQLQASDFAALEAALQRYAEHSTEMKIAYENSVKLREARKAHLESNPPKKRNTIINFRPTGASAHKYSN